MAKPQAKPQENFVRIMGTGVLGNKTLIYGLSTIKGVGIMFANALCHHLKLDKNKKINDLSDDEISKIEEFLTNPKKEGIPKWLLNQRKDYETGEDLHLTTKDIEFNDLQVRRRLGKVKSYRGLRLRLKLPVRGQRIKSNFRRSKTVAAMKSKSGGRK